MRANWSDRPGVWSVQCSAGRCCLLHVDHVLSRVRWHEVVCDCCGDWANKTTTATNQWQVSICATSGHTALHRCLMCIAYVLSLDERVGVCVLRVALDSESGIMLRCAVVLREGGRKGVNCCVDCRNVAVTVAVYLFVPCVTVSHTPTALDTTLRTLATQLERGLCWHVE